MQQIHSITPHNRAKINKNLISTKLTHQHKFMRRLREDHKMEFRCMFI